MSPQKWMNLWRNSKVGGGGVIPNLKNSLQTKLKFLAVNITTYFPEKGGRGGQKLVRVSPKIHPFLWGQESITLMTMITLTMIIMMTMMKTLSIPDLFLHFAHEQLMLSFLVLLQDFLTLEQR